MAKEHTQKTEALIQSLEHGFERGSDIRSDCKSVTQLDQTVKRNDKTESEVILLHSCRKDDDFTHGYKL